MTRTEQKRNYDHARRQSFRDAGLCWNGKPRTNCQHPELQEFKFDATLYKRLYMRKIRTGTIAPNLSDASTKP